MSEWKYKYMVTVEGIKVNYDPCEHCGGIPTDQDIKDQLALIDRNSRGPCVVCGEKAKVTEITIHHYKTRDVDRWGGMVMLHEEMGKISATFEGIQFDVSIHAKCMIRALPGAKLQQRLSFLEGAKNLTF